MDKEEIMREVVGIIRRHLSGAEFEVLLFGSWARGDAQETSDIDIGILGPRPVDDMTLWRIKGEIRAIPTLRRIDVVDLNTVEDGLKKNVLRHAKPL